MKIFNSPQTENQRDWRHAHTMYQIYPRSFNDSNNDGIGDLNGITEKLDYIGKLGFDVIWISPLFTSPQVDGGYDVSDYRDVQHEYGTLKDFDNLIGEAHKRDLKIVIDLVLSHTSDQHAWFQESRKSRDNDYSDYYVWANPGPDGEPPNNWVSVFDTGSSWIFDETRQQYYLCHFVGGQQPQLNYHNPIVQKEVLDVVEFWLKRGVDGFRLDVANFYFHDRKLRNNPPRPPGSRPATQIEYEAPDGYSSQAHIHDKSQPENLVFLQKMRKIINSYGAKLTIGELGDDDVLELARQYTKYGRLYTSYDTDLMAGGHTKLTTDMIRNQVERIFENRLLDLSHWLNKLTKPIEKVLRPRLHLLPKTWQAPALNFLEHFSKGLPTNAFSNHDVTPVASRWCEDGEGFGHDPRLSKMLNVLLGSLPGNACYYQGQELGLPAARLELDEMDDPWSKKHFKTWKSGRDGCRTPMPQSSKLTHGFSNEKPKKLKFYEPHRDLSIDNQEADQNSTLNLTGRFLQWRKTQDVLLNGKIKFLDIHSPGVLAFERQWKNQKMILFFNLEAKEKSVKIDANLRSVFSDNAVENGFIEGGLLQLPAYGLFIGAPLPD